jgi:hypothetical protein
MLAPDLVDPNPAIGFLQNSYNLAFRKSRFLHLNLQAKSCQKVLLFACPLNGEADDRSIRKGTLKDLLITFDRVEIKLLKGEKEESECSPIAPKKTVIEKRASYLSKY